MVQADPTSLTYLRWRCRRGMLELDLILEAFLDKTYSSLSTHQQVLFRQLLEETDPQLFTWLIGSETPDNKEINDLIACIRHAKTSP